MTTNQHSMRRAEFSDKLGGTHGMGLRETIIVYANVQLLIKLELRTLRSWAHREGQFRNRWHKFDSLAQRRVYFWQAQYGDVKKEPTGRLPDINIAR
jgi:hypothetical protein